MRYSFTVRVSGLNTEADNYEDALYEAGCSDALIAVIGDSLFLDFDRDAPSLEEAIRSATLDTNRLHAGLGLGEGVNAGEKMHQRAGVKLHHRGR